MDPARRDAARAWHPPSGRAVRVRAAATALAALVAACAAPPPPGPLPAGVALPAPAPDRARFTEIFCAVAARDEIDCVPWLWTDPADRPTGRPVAAGLLRRPWRVIVVSGFGSDCFAPFMRAFDDAVGRLELIGARLEHAPVSGLASGSWNARIVADTVTALSLAPGERLVLVGYSKGAPDILEALVADPAARARVAAVVSVAGAMGGTPLAEDAPPLLAALVEHAPGTACGPHDGGAIAAMHPSVRAAWLAENAGRWQAPVYALAGFAERERVSALLQPGWDSLAEADRRNDGQLTLAAQSAPGARTIGHPRADHWAVALNVTAGLPLAAALVDRNEFPRGVLAEALLRFLDEAAGAQIDP